MGCYALAVAALSGCISTPALVRPSLPAATGYGAPELTAATTQASGVSGAESQRFLAGKPVPQQWWRQFGSEKLNALVQQALAASPSVAAAQASLRGAEQLALAAGSGLFPSVDASASGSRQKVDVGSFGDPNGGAFIYNLFNANVAVSYTVDWFGATARGLEASAATVQAQRFQAEAAYQTLIANVVSSAVQQALDRALLAGHEEVLADQERLLAIAQKQFELGALARVQVLELESSLAAGRARLPLLRNAVGREQTRLALLLGQAPSATEVTDLALTELTLPQQLPVSLPSELLRQRADVLAAEAELQRAEALLGVAHANRFPALNLSASYGSQSTRLEDLFQGDIWSLGAGLTAPIFRAGELAARENAARADAEVAAAHYQQTVLAAFADVANALRQLGSDAETLKANLAAMTAAERTRQITEQQLRLGAVSSSQGIMAGQAYTQAKAAAAQSLAARYQSTVALYQALGGGWAVAAQGSSEAPAASAP
jgi:NodT family efflux transporter outer membrane factor (OMF) lipoprotein